MLTLKKVDNKNFLSFYCIVLTEFKYNPHDHNTYKQL